MPVSISESAALNMPADDNEVITRGVTIHRYIDTMYDDTMPRVKYRCLEYKKTPSTFSYNFRQSITTNVCILVQSHVSGLDIRTARTHEESI